MFVTCNVPGSPHFKYFTGDKWACKAWLKDIQWNYPPDVWEGAQFVSLADSKTWTYPDGSPVFIRKQNKKGAGRPKNKRKKSGHTHYMSDELSAYLSRVKDTLDLMLIDPNPEAGALLTAIEEFYSEG